MAQSQRQADVHQDDGSTLGKYWTTFFKIIHSDSALLLRHQKELTTTLDDFRTIFQLPQATDNNHECFVAAPKFLEMALFFLNDIAFILELRSPSNFKKTDHADAAEDIILQDTIQLSNAEQKSHDDLEAKQNEEKVKEHLIAEEIDKLVEGT
ncbi:hypothetical protein Tco_0327444 [Tanacetum coccineum]